MDRNQPAIHCSHTGLQPTASLVENPRNPNRHPPEQIRLLAKVIQATGWRSPIVVSRRSGFVVKGHGRLAAARLAGMAEVPVDLQDYQSEADEWADMIADNRLAELAEMDGAELRDLLGQLGGEDFDLELAGFTGPEADSLLEGLAIPDGNKPIDEEELAKTNSECPKCGFEWMA